MVCTTCLVCRVSSVSGCCNNDLGRPSASSGHMAKLEHSTFLRYLWARQHLVFMQMPWVLWLVGSIVVVMPNFWGFEDCPNAGEVSRTPQCWGYGVVVGKLWDRVRITIMVHGDVPQKAAVALSTCGTRVGEVCLVPVPIGVVLVFTGSNLTICFSSK